MRCCEASAVSAGCVLAAAVVFADAGSAVVALTEREAAVLRCFREQPWVDRDNEALDRCLAKISDAVWRAKR